ncbi:MAG: hypothetical protein NXH85_16740 [Pseudomonadaceae bacterium]|nr:hypothetical protein [Pseudomonadaceae bacterium]
MTITNLATNRVLVAAVLATLLGWASLASAEPPQLIEPGIVYSVNPGNSQAEISGAIYQFTTDSDVEVAGSTSSMVALAPGMKVEITYLMHPDRYREVVFLEQLPDDLEIEEF